MQFLNFKFYFNFILINYFIIIAIGSLIDYFYFKLFNLDLLYFILIKINFLLIAGINFMEKFIIS